MITPYRQEIIVTPEGFVRRSVSEEIVPGAEQAIALALSKSVKILTHIGVNQLGGAAHIRISDSEIVVASQLPFLHLTSSFIATADGDVSFLTPSFSQHDSSTKLINPVWTPPEFMRIWFVTVDPERRVSSDAATCFLIFTRTDKPGIFRLPLGNLYGDGRICTGEDHKHWLSLHRSKDRYSRLHVHMESINQFMASSWNGDLFSGLEKSRILFRFDLDGVQQTTPLTHTAVSNATESVSHLLLNWIAPLEGVNG